MSNYRVTATDYIRWLQEKPTVHCTGKENENRKQRRRRRQHNHNWVEGIADDSSPERLFSFGKWNWCARPHVGHLTQSVSAPSRIVWSRHRWMFQFSSATCSERSAPINARIQFKLKSFTNLIAFPNEFSFLVQIIWKQLNFLASRSAVVATIYEANEVTTKDSSEESMLYRNWLNAQPSYSITHLDCAQAHICRLVFHLWSHQVIRSENERKQHYTCIKSKAAAAATVAESRRYKEPQVTTDNIDKCAHQWQRSIRMEQPRVETTKRRWVANGTGQMPSSDKFNFTFK